MGKRIKQAGLYFLVLLLFLAGCAKAPDGEKSSANQQESSESAASSAVEPSSVPQFESDGKIRFVYDSALGPQSRLAEFGLWPDFELEFIAMDGTAIDDAILLEMASGAKSYDLAYTSAGSVRRHASLGLLEPLESMTEEKDILPAVLESLQVKETLYGYPTLARVWLLFYNTELFAQAGLEGPPETMEELQEYAILFSRQEGREEADGEIESEKDAEQNRGTAGTETESAPAAQQDAVAPWGLVFPGWIDANAGLPVAAYAYANAAQFVEGEVGAYQAVCDSANMLQTINLLQQLYVAGAVPPDIENRDEAACRELFFAGKAAMYVGPQGLYELSQQMHAVAGLIQAAPMPLAEKGASLLEVYAVSVFQDAPNLEDAIAVAKEFSFNSGNEITYSLYGGDMVPPRHTWFDAVLMTQEYAEDEAMEAYYELLLEAFGTARLADPAVSGEIGGIQELILEELQLIWAGIDSPRDGLAQLKESLEKELTAF